MAIASASAPASSEPRSAGAGGAADPAQGVPPADVVEPRLEVAERLERGDVERRALGEPRPLVPRQHRSRALELAVRPSYTRAAVTKESRLDIALPGVCRS